MSGVSIVKEERGEGRRAKGRGGEGGQGFVLTMDKIFCDV